LAVVAVNPVLNIPHVTLAPAPVHCHSVHHHTTVTPVPAPAHCHSCPSPCTLSLSTSSYHCHSCPSPCTLSLLSQSLHTVTPVRTPAHCHSVYHHTTNFQSADFLSVAVSRRPLTAEVCVSIPDHSIWDLWWTKWHWEGLFYENLMFRLSPRVHTRSGTFTNGMLPDQLTVYFK